MTNMKNYRFILPLFVAAALLSSCTNTHVKGSFTSVPAGKTIEAKTVEGSALRTLDTIKINKDGSFAYDLKLQEAQPEFIYLYYGDTKLASLLLKKGDQVNVECDTLGRWTVSGSDDCQVVLRNEQELASLEALGTVTLRQYMDHYRKMMKFVLGNSRSLTVVPVLFSTIGDTPVFGQLADGVVFNNVADSLAMEYPDSRYIKMLRSEGAVRTQQLELNTLIKTAGEASYIDLNFDGLEGKPVVLSEVAKKATLLVFWDAAEPTNKMFNLEVLKPLYEKCADKGFEIYAVNLNSDKTSWAIVVNEQKLPWVNVCDVFGRSINVYGVSSVPTVMLITDNNTERLENITLKGLESKVSAALR